MKLKHFTKTIGVTILILALCLGSLPAFAAKEEAEPDDFQVIYEEPSSEAEEAEDLIVIEENEGSVAAKESPSDPDETGEIPDASADGTTVDEDTVFYIKPISAKVYNGSAFELDPVIRRDLGNGEYSSRLKLGTDYTLSYANNVNAGTAVITVHFCGKYSGTQTVSFTIKPASFNPNSTAENHDFVKDITDKTYIGKEIRPDPIVKAYLGGKYVMLTRGTDYTVAYKNNINAGTAAATVKFRGNYAGSANVVKTFTIKPVSLTSATLPHASMEYTGTARTMSKAIVAKAKVNGEVKTLTFGTDFSVSYKNNIEIGTATVTIKGKGNFTGKITKTFEITKVPLYTAYFTQYSYVAGRYLKQNSFGYNGDLKKPSVVVIAKVGGKEVVLKRGTDYTITYSNNRNIGTAKATIVGQGNYTGKLIKKFTIHMIDYVQWAKYVADDNETYRNYGHTLPSKDSDGAFSCSSLVGAALYLNGYIPKLPPDGHGWLGGLNRDKQCLEGEMMRNGFTYYSRADLGAPSIMAQNCLSVLKPGDVMWRYHGGYGMHVGIYMGNGLFIESRGGTNDPNAIGVFPDFNYFEGIFRLDGKYLK